MPDSDDEVLRISGDEYDGVYDLTRVSRNKLFNLMLSGPVQILLFSSVLNSGSDLGQQIPLEISSVLISTGSSDCVAGVLPLMYQ